jgi:hypothetical protein
MENFVRRASTIAVGLSICAVLNGCERKTSTARSTSGVEPGHVVAPLEYLRKASDAELEDMILAAMESALRGKSQDEADKIIPGWSTGLQMLLSTSEVENEVVNGGFHQYFWNTQGIRSQMALQSFRLIHAEKHAALIQRAIDRYEQYRTQMDRFRKEEKDDSFARSEEPSGFDPLDLEYYKLEKKLGTLRIAYIRVHLEEFAIE